MIDWESPPETGYRWRMLPKNLLLPVKKFLARIDFITVFFTEYAGRSDGFNVSHQEQPKARPKIRLHHEIATKAVWNAVILRELNDGLESIVVYEE